MRLIGLPRLASACFGGGRALLEKKQRKPSDLKRSLLPSTPSKSDLMCSLMHSPGSCPVAEVVTVLWLRFQTPQSWDENAEWWPLGPSYPVKRKRQVLEGTGQYCLQRGVYPQEGKPGPWHLRGTETGYRCRDPGKLGNKAVRE